MAIGCDIDEPIIITDQENMISLMEQNITLNNLDSRVVPLVLNWQVLSKPYHETKTDITQGRAITRRSHLTKAECHSSRRLRIFRTSFPSPPCNSRRTPRAQPRRDHLFLLQEASKGRHAIHEESQEDVCRLGDRRY